MEKSKNKTGIVVGVFVVAVLAFVTVFLDKKSPESNQSDMQMPPVDMVKTDSLFYKDGTYTATGTYMSPGGEDKLTVSLTLKDNVIADVSVVQGAGDRTSVKFQNYFIGGYKEYVLGKNINEVHLTKVSGSSLTPKGFNDALEQIKMQAKA